MAIGYGLGILFTVGLGFFVWIKARRSTLATLFLLMNLSIAVVEFSIAGVGIVQNDRIAELISWLNMFNIFIVVFLAHWILEVIGRAQRVRIPLILIYVLGLVQFIYFLFAPEAFLLPPEQKLYLYHYFEPGPWYTPMRIYFALVTLYVLYELYVAYKAAVDNVIRNRLKYVLVGIIFGMIVGQTALFLVYDIPFDPIWSMFFPLGMIPFAYAVIRYELMDIKIVARRAVAYALLVAILSLMLGMVSFGSNLLAAYYPNVPLIALPIGVALFASALGFFVWFRFKENELLKYEFITVVTHKFRTPLTEIKWTVESLRGRGLPPEVDEGLRTIARADTALVELTNTLIKAAEAEETTRAYTMRPLSIQSLAQEVLKLFQREIAERRLRVRVAFPQEPVVVRADRERLAVVLQTIVENAVLYTPAGGTITATVSKEGNDGVCTITDSGIGISRANLPHVFEKFYRSDIAKRTVTEGAGIGLYIAKQIIDRHGGRISAFSEGEGKGARFSIALRVW